MLLIRAALVSDVPLLLRFFRELAEYGRQPNEVVVKEETLIKDGFGPQPKFRGLIAEWEGQAIGYAFFFGFYSSWKCPGIFLEDLCSAKNPYTANLVTNSHETHSCSSQHTRGMLPAP
jgi:hypothetical protein